MVNLHGTPAHGHNAVNSCSAIGRVVDAAYLCVPVSATLDAARDALEAGIKNLVVVSSGFAETGADGKRAERALIELTAGYGARFLGPNCLGHLNYVDQVAVGAIVAEPAVPSAVALISVSGACATELLRFAARQGLGFSHVIATGNEAGITMGDILDYLIEHPAVKSVALFAEMIRSPASFSSAAIRALQRGKALVILKVGSSPNTAAVATAHTGAVVGDDRVFSAVCRRLGIVRVSNFEDLVLTAHTLARVQPLQRPGVAIISTSGGACDVISDLADSNNLTLPEFQAAAKEELRQIVSAFGNVHNPIDLTGAVSRDMTMYGNVIRAISSDSEIGMIVCHQDPPVNPPGESESPLDKASRRLLESISAGVRSASTPAVVLTTFANSVNEHGRQALLDYGLFALPGITNGLAAIGKAVWWSQRVAKGAPGTMLARGVPIDDHPVGEREALGYLHKHGVRVVPAELVKDAEAAMRAAASMGFPVVLKIASPDIAHKTDLGGVRLDLPDRESVGRAFDEMMSSVGSKAPAARIDGALVCPMRTRGIELIVGFLRDPQWGLTLALGLGGVWVDILTDVVVLVLPVTRDDIVAALRELRAARLLDGYRNLQRADSDVIATAVLDIADAVSALGPNLAAFEVNPLLVSGSETEALDALAVWQ
jgi:acyl-CoA synthetase (NDP forming)